MFPKIPSDALLLSMTDVQHPLATYSHHAIELDGAVWPSVEHYVNGMRFPDPTYREQIRSAAHPAMARKLGKSWFRTRHADWKKTREIYMTRALWTKCLTWPDVAKALLDTGDRLLVETSEYDYFWGCGRDLRGHNKYGKVLMAVRERLRQRAAASEQGTTG